MEHSARPTTATAGDAVAGHPGLVRLIGWSAVLGAIAYFVSDVIELVQGGFSDGQLWLTLVGEALVPPVILGLALVKRSSLGRLGIVGAVVYAYSFVYFTGTVVYALVNDTKDFAQLNDELGIAMTVHGALMLLGGVVLGYVVVRTAAYPRWTGIALAVGVVLVVLGLPSLLGLLAAGTRDAAFVGMGLALLRVRPADDEPARVRPRML